jgi:hypothetical protein
MREPPGDDLDRRAGSHRGPFAQEDKRMSDFVLEISGDGNGITLDAVGIVDVMAARTLADVLDTLARDRYAAGIEVRLDRVTSISSDARAILAERGLAVGEPVGSGAR